MVDQYVVVRDGIWRRLEAVWLRVLDDKRLRENQLREVSEEEQRKVQHDGQLGDADSKWRVGCQKSGWEYMNLE